MKEFLKKYGSSLIFLAYMLMLIGVILFAHYSGKKKDKQIEELTVELNYYKDLNSAYENSRDSLIYDILKRDSVITIIKYNYDEKKMEIENYNDSLLIAEFEKLLRSN